MTAKKTSFDKRFRAPLDEEPMVFDNFSKPSKEIKGLENTENIKETVKAENTEALPKNEEAPEIKSTREARVGAKQKKAVAGLEIKALNFDDYKVDPGKNEGTVTKTFTLDNASDSKLKKITLALDVPLRVLFSNMINEFYDKHEKEIKKQLSRKLDM